MNHTQQFRDLCMSARARVRNAEKENVNCVAVKWERCDRCDCACIREQTSKNKNKKNSNINFWLVPSTFVSLRAFFRVVLFSFFCSFIGGFCIPF